jgi:hypothetical protein
MIDHNWEHWGHLKARYNQSRPRRMLALDGGGIRGLTTLKVLKRVEDLLRNHYAADDGFRLCQFFDYVGGTSTGAIIAAGIARGMSVDEVLKFYREFGKAAFTKSSFFDRWKNLYDGGPLQEKLQDVFSKTDNLEPEYLQSLLLVVTRNASTDSAWPISSNPSAKYNDLKRPDCNLRIPLWKLVRASTAAPAYFPPEVIRWDQYDPEKHFVFVDGGTTSYNNPAFCMTRMAVEPRYRLGWEPGERNLLCVSIGTGHWPAAGTTSEDPEMNMLSNALNTLSALMNQAAFDQDVSCRTIGRCSYGHSVDGEIGDLVPRRDATNPKSDLVSLDEDLGRAFLYARYDVELTDKALAKLGFDDIKASDVATLDSVDAMKDLERIGDKLAKEIKLEHFGSFVDVPLSGGDDS